MRVRRWRVMPLFRAIRALCRDDGAPQYARGRGKMRYERGASDARAAIYIDTLYVIIKSAASPLLRASCKERFQRCAAPTRAERGSSIVEAAALQIDDVATGCR